MIVLMQAILIIGLAMLLFDVKIVGRVFDFFIALTIGMIAFISLGYAVASIAKTPESASGIANLLFIPMTFLSGVYFPADSLPGFLQPLVKVLPLTHLVNAIRDIFNQGAGLFEVGTELTILLGWIVVCMIFSINRFKWELELPKKYWY
jgi:ABC-2 type transport system permease protein